MIIDFRDLRKNDGLLVKHEELQIPEIASAHVQVEELSPADVQVEARLVDDVCTVNGNVRYSVTYNCTRCLEPFVAKQETVLFEEFTEDARRVNDDVHLAPQGIAELDPWVEQAIHLDIEFFPVCKSDCRGLCPVCGVNRNHQDCNCDVTTIDPRLAALSDLLSTDESE
ncbi:YceD family protein [Alicyclobacillus ferrooxydans]|uniref:YceD family protein n=1 Tax=Alicyclobacillus ferrooxydans TaxID=471514 RepID=UPI0006D58720|nr:DUF177 domain-containing protein [Alicyclobacillus ferrooxydans]